MPVEISYQTLCHNAGLVGSSLANEPLGSPFCNEDFALEDSDAILKEWLCEHDDPCCSQDHFQDFISDYSFAPGPSDINTFCADKLSIQGSGSVRKLNVVGSKGVNGFEMSPEKNCLRNGLPHNLCSELFAGTGDLVQQVFARESHTRCAALQEDSHVASLRISLEQRKHIVAQMQQHVQLLTQFYALTCCEPKWRVEMLACKTFLDELVMLCRKARSVYASQPALAHLSAFCAPGIEEASGIASALCWRIFSTPCVRRQQKSRPRLHPSSDLMNLSVATVLATEPYFATFLELVPESGLVSSAVPSQMKASPFSKSEDNLLALGLCQYKNKYSMISDNLLPNRSAQEIQRRVKRLRSSARSKPPADARLCPACIPRFNIRQPREVSRKCLLELPRTDWQVRDQIPRWLVKQGRLICDVLNRIGADQRRKRLAWNLSIPNIHPSAVYVSPEKRRCESSNEESQVILYSCVRAQVICGENLPNQAFEA